VSLACSERDAVNQQADSRFAHPPLRVLVMISSMDGGGSERQTLLLLQHLDRTRFAPELYLLRRCGSLLSQVPADVPIHSFEDAACREHWPTSKSGRPSPLRYVQSVVSRWCQRLPLPGKIHRRQIDDLARVIVAQQIDVVYDRTFHMSLIAAEAVRYDRVPRVSTIVSPPSRAVPLNAGRFVGLKRRRLRRAYRESAAVIAVSQATARDAAAYYRLPRHGFRVISNPVDAQALARIVSSQARPQRDQRYTIACVGRISVEKGQAELLLALDHLRSHYPEFPLPKVWFLGEGPLRESLIQEAKRLNLSDCVDWLGHVEHPAPWIAAADAVCITSHFEGFPNVMLEAMALGVPVIARSIDAVRSLGRIPQDPSIRGLSYVATFGPSANRPGIDLALKLRRCKLNTTATRSRTAAAKRLAQEELSIEKGIAQIEQILVKVTLDSWHLRCGS